MAAVEHITMMMLLRRMTNELSHHTFQLNKEIPTLYTLVGYRRRFINASSSKSKTKDDQLQLPSLLAATTTMEPINKLLSTVQLFKTGLERLKVDFLNSLHIQQAELTRLHLDRRIRRDYELRRQRLRNHERHGIHIVDSTGQEVSFIPSTSYNIHDQQQTQHAKVNRFSHSTHSNLSKRRPQEHLRQISRDLQTTLPTVAAFLFVPFVGYSFLLLGMMFPRLLLSRQFHTRVRKIYILHFRVVG